MDTNSECVVPVKDKPLKKLNQIAKRFTVNLEFQDLKCSVRDVNAKTGWKQILHSISGKFRCGEITAILGPSGAGKTTLLNILAGYINEGVEGTIKDNNSPRKIDVFKKLSCYIMQDNIVQPRLTVKEAMTFATRFKLGGTIKDEERLLVMEEVIDFLGLTDCANIRSEHLSGGQKKRLTIALELVNNPAVIFLDEPTTGLDDFSVKHCIDLLKKISQLDRTVIFSIHQPSSFLFQYFDQVYSLADGVCVYNGSPQQLVPFLSITGHPCPSNYSPSDYLIELVNLCPSTIPDFKKATENGKINKKEILSENLSSDKETAVEKKHLDFPISFHTQFYLILSRLVLQMKRNKIGYTIDFFTHLLCGIVIGLMFEGIGNDGSQTITIIKLCACCNTFLVYSNVMIPTISYPFEVQLLKKEYFNRWYSLKAYCFAHTVFTLPLPFIFSTMFTILIYFLTDLPKEIHRFVGFYIICLLTTFASQEMGYFIGAVVDTMKAVIIGPIVLVFLTFLSFYGFGHKAVIHPLFNVVLKLDYIRTGFHGLFCTIFYQRPPLDCHDVYCHYADATLLARDNTIDLIHYMYYAANMLIFLVTFRVLMFMVLEWRLGNYRFSARLIYNVKRLTRTLHIV